MRIDAAVVRPCHFHEKLGLRLDASSFRPPLAERLGSPRDRRDFRKRQKYWDRVLLLAEPRG